MNTVIATTTTVAIALLLAQEALAECPDVAEIKKRCDVLESATVELDKRIKHNHKMTGEEFMTQRHLREDRIRPIEVYIDGLEKRIEKLEKNDKRQDKRLDGHSEYLKNYTAARKQIGTIIKQLEALKGQVQLFVTQAQNELKRVKSK